MGARVRVRVGARVRVRVRVWVRVRVGGLEVGLGVTTARSSWLMAPTPNLMTCTRVRVRG